LDPVQRLLEGGRDGLRDHVCAGTRVHRRDRDLRRRNVRIHRHRQRTKRREPGDDDERRDDGREQRPIDEEVRDHGAVSPAADASDVPSSTTGVALTTAPGCTLRMPSTTTRSPRASPLMATTLLPDAAPSTTGRGATCPLPSTSHT